MARYVVKRDAVGKEPPGAGRGPNADLAGPAMWTVWRADLFRVLRLLLDGPLPKGWVVEVSGLPEDFAERMMHLMEEEGILVSRSGSAFPKRPVLEYAPGVGEIVRRVLDGSGLPGTAPPMMEGEMEAFVRLLKALIRLELSAEDGYSSLEGKT